MQKKNNTLNERDARPSYVAPKAMRLDDLYSGAGFCFTPGSGDNTAGCFRPGNSAVLPCSQPGNTATGDCAPIGNSV